MDYIKEINAFYDHDLVNQLTPSAGYFYLALLNIANRLFWKESFMVSDVMLMARSGIKDRRTFKRVIKELVDFGLIIVKETECGTAYTIRGLASLFPARNAAPLAAAHAAKNASSRAANHAERANMGAWNAALFAENPADFSKSPASDAASNAGADASQAPSHGIPGTAQTKPNIINKTEIAAAGEDAGQACGADSDERFISELVQTYHAVPGIKESDGDFAFITALFKEYGCEPMRYAIGELAMAAAAGKIQKPLHYLRAILKRAGPGSGPRPPTNIESSREEDPLERYQRERYRG